MKSVNKIKTLLAIFIFLLLLSGITAFPLKSEIDFLSSHLNSFPVFMQTWILRITKDIYSTPEAIFYGTDWLAFAHIIISLFFFPVFLNPVRYKTNVLIGMIACFAVFPLAFVCGPIRGIPFFHQIIDCSFGVGGMLLLYLVYTEISKLEKLERKSFQ